MRQLKLFLLTCLLTMAAAVAANAQWKDVTIDYVTNPDFENGTADGWVVSVTSAQNYGFQGAWYENRESGVMISRFVEAWRPGATLGETWIFQQISVPKGKYRLSADAIASWQNDASVQPKGVYLYVDTYGSEWIRTTPVASRNGEPEHFEIEFEREEDSDIYIGVKTDGDTNCNWIAIDNFKLEMLTASYVDVTDDYIKNPNYDGCDFSYWEGTGLSAVGGRDNAEHYQKTYDTYQTITGLTPGKRYRLSLSAFYRCGGAGDDYRVYSSGDYADSQRARLYVETGGTYSDTGIALASSAALSQSLGGGVSRTNGGYIPNNMEAAHYWFEEGYYLNQVEFVAGSDGKARIGIRKDETVSGDWTCIDTWRLELADSQIVPLESMRFTLGKLSMCPGDSRQLEVVFTPADATIKKCQFYSDNESVAKIDKDGNVTALAVGTATIVAYTTEGVTAECSITVERPVFVPGSLVINEIQAANVDCVMDPSFNYGSWIELYNPTDKACGLAGLYVTDDPADLKKHPLSYLMGAVPAHGYKNIWFDHYGIWNMGEVKQVSFKLNYDGGTIIISDGDKILVQQDYPQAIGRTSYARTNDGGTEWGISATPTPEGSNAGMAFATEQLAAPVVDKDGQVFDGRLTVKVTIPAGTTLRYTTDGSTPTLENGEKSTTGRFTVDWSTSFRFRLFKSGYIPSEVVTRSYLQDDSGLPIIALATDDDNLYSSETGLFEKGPNGRAGNGQDSKCNWNMDWDRPANFEYITENNEYVLSQEVDMSTCGGWSRANWPKSFKLKAAKYYQGRNSLDYQFFEGKPYLKHKTLQIRNGGNDGTRMTDASLQELVRRSGLDVEGQAYKAVRVYINGSHYADLNMREPNNKHYGYANWGIDTDEMDQFEISPDSGYVQMTGTIDSWNRLKELSKDAANSNSYAEIGKLLDIDEFINYMAVELYVGNWDWPQNNVKAFRDRNNGKFRFVLFDLDGAFSADINTFRDKYWRTTDGLRGEDAFGNSLWGQNKTYEQDIVMLFQNLIQNDDFRRRFVDALCVVGGSTFCPDFANGIIDEMGQEIGASWKANELKNTLRNRQSSVANWLTWGTYDFGVSSSQAFTASLASNVDGAGIYVNDMPVPTGQFAGKLYKPVTVKAVTPAGYKFAGWKSGRNINYKETTLFDMGATWSYYDDGSLDGKTWKTGSLPSGWKSGKTPIGYNRDNDLATLTAQKLPTYYFRTTKTLASAPTSGTEFTLTFDVDDGFIIYVNGTEAARHNMPQGDVSYNTYASTYSDGQYDSGTIDLPASLFKKGSNIIAVEVHNNDGVSSDARWNASLVMREPATGTTNYVSTEAEYKLPSTAATIDLTAVYEPLTDSELASNGVMPVKVNEISAGNTMYVNDQFKKDDWVELYNTTDKPIDVAGMYLSDDADQPQKFQIPDNDVQQTVIEPHSHLVVWASKRGNIGEQVHTNFKLGNTNGQSVVLTSENGEWSDKLDYDAHDGKESVGLYPDGGKDVYKMQRPTIGKANALTSYAQYLYTSTCRPANPGDEVAFALVLNEGWNWMSHPLARNIATSEINAQALRVVSQTNEAVKDATLGWTGTLTTLTATEGYKVQMAADATYRFDGPFYEPARRQYLHKGWNWIGYPLPASQSVAEALGRFTPSEGDKLIGRQGIATYENGKWSGTLGKFEAGQGYMYKSAEPKSLAFKPVESQTQSSRIQVRSFHAQPRTPWTAVEAAYPDVMGMVAVVSVNDATAGDGEFCVGAFDEDGECRGVGRYVDGHLYLNVYGNAGEAVVFKAAEAGTGVVYDVAERFNFTSDIVGSRQMPVKLHIGEATGIASLRSSTAVESSAFYTLGGTMVGSSSSQLESGVYIQRYVLNTGKTITKKIIIK